MILGEVEEIATIVDLDSPNPDQVQVINNQLNLYYNINFILESF
jgi:hypothetical protein